MLSSWAESAFLDSWLSGTVKRCLGATLPASGLCDKHMKVSLLNHAVLLMCSTQKVITLLIRWSQADLLHIA